MQTFLRCLSYLEVAQNPVPAPMLWFGVWKIWILYLGRAKVNANHTHLQVGR